MATVGGFSRHHHLDELNDPLVTNEGVLSPGERKALARANLGIATGTEAFPATTDDETVLIDGNGTGDGARTVLITVTVTAAFADGTGGQPVFQIGETGNLDKFMATTVLADAALGSTFSFAGELSEGDDLIVDGTAATGDGTGAIAVTAVVIA